MILDAHNVLATLQTVATDAASEYTIDMTKLGDAVAGAELYLVARVGTAFDTTEEDGTLAIQIESDSAEDFSTNSTKIIHACSDDLAEAALTANKIVWKVKLPPGLQRYLRVYFNVGTHAFTAGTIDVFLTPDVDIA